MTYRIVLPGQSAEAALADLIAERGPLGNRVAFRAQESYGAAGLTLVSSPNVQMILASDPLALTMPQAALPGPARA
jgi:hypothetical protein